VVAVEDVLQYGEDREPRWPRWPRWLRLALAGAGVAVVVAAALAWYLPGSRQHGPPPQPAASGSSAAGGSGSADVGDPLPTKPALMAGHPLARADGVRLLVGGEQPAWLQVPSGHTEPIRGLPGRGQAYQLLPIGGGWTAEPFAPGKPGCGSCAPASPQPVYYIADGAAAASRVGTADVTAPAAVPGALWLVSYRPYADMSTAAGTAREVSVTGAALGLPVSLPPGYTIYQGTRAGLLLAQEQGDAGQFRYELWDPGTGRVTRSIMNVIAESPTQIAWIPACGDSCVVHVLKVADGRAARISLPRKTRVGRGAFSPDGRLLALQVMAGTITDGFPATSQLMVATLATGQLTALPGTTVGSGIGLAFGWQPGTRQLICDLTVSGPAQPQWQVGVWQPGDARLSTALARTAYQSWPVIDQGPY